MDKKKIYVQITQKEDPDEISMNTDLKNLHYSEAGKSPRLSDLGEPKTPKPARMKTNFMNLIYHNVDQAMNYDPMKMDRPIFSLHIQPPPKNIGYDENNLLAVARAHKKSHQQQQPPTRKQI